MAAGHDVEPEFDWLYRSDDIEETSFSNVGTDDVANFPTPPTEAPNVEADWASGFSVPKGWTRADIESSGMTRIRKQRFELWKETNGMMEATDPRVKFRSKKNGELWASFLNTDYYRISNNRNPDTFLSARSINNKALTRALGYGA